MRVAVLRERRTDECRVAASPETVKKIIELGLDVIVEKGAGEAANFSDDMFIAAGAKIGSDLKATLKNADIVLKVQGPLAGDEGDIDEILALPDDACLIGMLSAQTSPNSLKAFAAKNISAFSLELVPRITRAQTMDVLSSQSNLAGYRAVVEATETFSRAFPMMMTAAGTVPPARVLVLGAGVAGLQAIATARRLGAIVSAFDVRAAAKEQVESLGASFIEVESIEDAETKGGYAKEMSKDYQKRQADKIHETLKKADIAICTALIPGRPAPILITEPMVKDMKRGAVIVDMAVSAGGNCTLSAMGKVVTKHGVKIVGYSNLASRIAEDASALYARNVLNFLKLLVDSKDKKLHINQDDEIIKATLVTFNKKVLLKSQTS